MWLRVGFIMRWTKSVIDKFSSDTAIMCHPYHIARFITYINGQKVERYLLSDCSSFPHKSLKWFDDADSAKSYLESL